MNRSSQACEWLDLHSDATVQELADLVAIPGISTDGMHGTELDHSAGMVASLAQAAGFPEVEIIRPEDGYPAVLASWVVDPAASTILFLSHHDVQPVNFAEKWRSEPWQLVERDGRLFGRGSADDKGGVIAQLAAVKAWKATCGAPPVNVRILVEGEEEIGSRNLIPLV
jgi:acetylornithine deacetylase/succinyl-diaminopimelate desuccinylase-like protein